MDPPCFLVFDLNFIPFLPRTLHCALDFYKFKFKLCYLSYEQTAGSYLSFVKSLSLQLERDIMNHQPLKVWCLALAYCCYDTYLSQQNQSNDKFWNKKHCTLHWLKRANQISLNSSKIDIIIFKLSFSNYHFQKDY